MTFFRASIGDHLLTRLHQLGVDTVFGVPGDFNLSLLERLMRHEELRWVGNCNELNAAYAADGYARMKGVGAVLVTYGVGDLSAINGMAGSFAEHLPVICISGIPSMRAIRQRLLLHHTSGTGNLEDVMNCMTQFTAAQARITHANAVVEIDRVLCTALREKRPVYLQIPSDIVNLEVELPDDPLAGPSRSTDKKQLADVVEQIVHRLEKAERPAILIDGDAHRFGLRPWICVLGQMLGIRFAAMASGRTIFDEQNPLYCGIYAGGGSTPETAALIEQSDCLLAVGVRFFDATTCVYTQQIPERSMIALDPFSAVLDDQTFEGVTAEEILRELIQRFGGRRARPTAPSQHLQQKTASLYPLIAKLHLRMRVYGRALSNSSPQEMSFSLRTAQLSRVSAAFGCPPRPPLSARLSGALSDTRFQLCSAQCSRSRRGGIFCLSATARCK